MELLLRMFRNAYSGGRVCSKAAEQKIINACKSKNIRIGIKGEIILEERKKCRHTITLCVCASLQLQAGLCLKVLVQSMKQVKWAVAGTGYIANEFAKGMQEVEDAVLAAVVSRSIVSGRAFAQKYGCDQVYTEL